MAAREFPQRSPSRITNLLLGRKGDRERASGLSGEVVAGETMQCDERRIPGVAAGTDRVSLQRHGLDRRGGDLVRGIR